MTTQSKLLKLAKNLNRFSLDDLLIMSEESEDDLHTFLSEAIENNNIKKEGEDKFVFISMPEKMPDKVQKKVLGPRVFKPQALEDIIDPKTQRNDYKIFMNEPEYSQRKILKYLLVFKAARDMKGHELKTFLAVWSKQYPEYKTSVASYCLNKKKYLRDGIIALISSYKNKTSNQGIPDEIYSKFKELYLSPRQLSASQCIEIIKRQDEDMEAITPAISSLLRKIKKDFSHSEIEYYRKMPMEMPEFIKPQKTPKEEKVQIKNPMIKTFKDAGKHFLKSDYCKNLKPSTLLSYKGYVENQLTPYFYESPLNEITEARVNEFKHSMLNDGLSTSTVNKYIDILIIIVNTYSQGTKLPDSVKFNNERNYYQDMRILEIDEVKKLLQTANKHYPDFYPLLLTAVSTGMTRGELLALTWQDVLWTEKKIRVNKSLYKGKIVKHKTKNSARNIDISGDLITVLKVCENECVKGKGDFIFPNTEGESMDPDNMIKRRFMPVVRKSSIPPIRFIDLRDIYASLLIKQNLPLIYIQEQLGHSSPQVTAERYKFLLEKNQVKKLNILNGML